MIKLLIQSLDCDVIVKTIDFSLITTVQYRKSIDISGNESMRQNSEIIDTKVAEMQTMDKMCTSTVHSTVHKEYYTPLGCEYSRFVGGA